MQKSIFSFIILASCFACVSCTEIIENDIVYYYQKAIVCNETGHDVTIHTSYGTFFLNNNECTDTLGNYLLIHGYFDTKELKNLGNNVEFVFDDNHKLYHRYLSTENGISFIPEQNNIMQYSSWKRVSLGNLDHDSSTYTFTLTENDYNLSTSE